MFDKMCGVKEEDVWIVLVMVMFLFIEVVGNIVEVGVIVSLRVVKECEI